MVVCTDLTSQNRTASGIQLKHKEKVIVGARTQQIKCRNQAKFPDFWNTHRVCDTERRHQITIQDKDGSNMCQTDMGTFPFMVNWHTDNKVPELHYQTGHDIFLPSIRCEVGKYSNSASGYFQCKQTRPGRMECVCNKPSPQYDEVFDDSSKGNDVVVETPHTRSSFGSFGL